MENFKPELVRIVEQASRITERLGTEFLLSKTSDSDDIVNSRIERWCQAAAKGDLEKFQKRLTWDGLNLSTVSSILGNVSLSDTQNLPGLLETFKAGIEAKKLSMKLEKSVNSNAACRV